LKVRPTARSRVPERPKYITADKAILFLGAVFSLKIVGCLALIRTTS
jgi:hypothetical protein